MELSKAETQPQGDNPAPGDASKAPPAPGAAAAATPKEKPVPAGSPTPSPRCQEPQTHRHPGSGDFAPAERVQRQHRRPAWEEMPFLLLDNGSAEPQPAEQRAASPGQGQAGAGGRWAAKALAGARPTSCSRAPGLVSLANGCN